MKYSIILSAAFSATSVLAHGVVTEVQGANGVNLPGLSLIDGTPRDCATPSCGAEADTSIIRQNELGTSKASALGRTNGGGAVDASKMVALFMDGASGNSSAVKAARELHAANLAMRAAVLPRAGSSGGGTKTPKGTKEAAVKAATGAAATSGLPTTQDDGTITMTFHQVNQDGAGPLKAAIDATSGGSDPSAFKTAAVTTNVPGIGIGGLSAATTMDFPVAVQMPAGMTCQGSVGGAENACVVRLQNSAAAGPFGGSVVFTQSPAAKKRAIEFNLMKAKRFARALENSQDQE
ncbi:putative mas3 protein [Diplogelasinospora grovesii]|uniref:Mas3 protein n=1 Tax=Diplogelasinospora grovesii TaxID=303347 RepID=A0AAN6NHJ2_9PEZI|nr:putative mas3 protein [Diplogelasinospora grovesii]